MQTIRRARSEDALGIHEAHMRSICEVCSKDHSTEEIRGWGSRPYREDQRLNAIKNQFVWVVDNAGKIEGYGHLAVNFENGLNRAHVMGLYLVPEANGKGFGVAIAREMIAEAKRQNVSEINLESTLTAHGFYQKMGFVDSGAQATIELGGSKVRYIPMRMVL